MRAHTPTNVLFRTAIAVLFGLMSLLHGPVMTFAKAGAAPSHHAMHASHAEHGHHGVPEKDSQPAGPGAAPVCYAFGCLIAVESLPVRVLATVLEPIGRMSPGTADTMLAADIEPAVPPPRLQV